MKIVLLVVRNSLFFIFHFAFFVLHFSFSCAQVPTVQDCLGAIPICQEAYIEYDTYSGSGHYPNEIYNRPGDCTQDCPGSCLDGEINSVWYVITVQNDGILRFAIDPGNNDDFDWALYDLTNHSCSDIYTDYLIVQKSCNAYGYSPNGLTGISSENGGTSDCNHCGSSGTKIWNSDLYVTEGSVYVLVVEDWIGTGDGFTINFGASTARISDENPPQLDTVFTDPVQCGTTELEFAFSERVKCDLLDATDLMFSGPSGPYTILDVQGTACVAGADMERRFTLLLDRPLISNGDYSLVLVPGNDVIDGCDNIALADTLAFVLDLGAPVLTDTGVVITPAYEAMNNGSITGLAVSGNEPLLYRWYDHFNDTIGTDLDLYNVYTGNYFLEIVDDSGCETNAGPYFVDLIESNPESGNMDAGILSVYPNPGNGSFTIKTDREVVSVSVTGMSGQLVYSFDKPQISDGIIHTGNRLFSPGIYMIRAVTAGGMVSSRLVQVL